MDDSERDKLLGTLNERTKLTLDAVTDIKTSIITLFEQTRDHESRISSIEGGKSLLFKIIGVGAAAGGSTFGISKLVEKLLGHS